MGPKIGFLSFVPDGGHVLPLIRIAAAFREHGYDIQCYFPEESLKYAAIYNVPVKSLGAVTTGRDEKLFARLSKRSVFYNDFSTFMALEKGYSRVIKVAIASKLEDIKELIDGEHLSMLIADDNIFNEFYILLAASAKIPLVTHRAEGNYRYLQSHYISAYGVSKHTPLIQSAIEIMGLCLEILCQLWQIICYGRFYHNLYLSLLKPFSGINPQEVPIIHITTGLAFLEKERISNIQKPKGELVSFPPLSGGRNVAFSPELQKWFDETKKPVVYISFGTVIKGDKRLFRKIINGLKDLDVDILWSAPRDQRLLLEEIGVLPNMRVEEFVPQPEVLAMEQVRCFITHGGAGSIQESLFCGKPILCIPFMFDQPYNGSIVAALGAGIRLWKNRVSSRSVKASIEQLLNRKPFWDAAQDIKGKLREADGGDAVIRYFQETGLLHEK